MILSNAFNYINVLDKAADASWTRETLISNNLANVNTPRYKRRDIDFQSVFRRELSHYKYRSLDDKVDDLNEDLSVLNANVYIDHARFKYRMDGNNVDIDTEEVELASEQLRYQGLTTSMTQEFSRMKTVLSS